jgi:arylsulfatase A-like enzyme
MEGWDRDFYDDSILEFDMNVGRIVEALKQHGLWEDTLLIIGSDHAAEFNQRERIPLLMHFPGGKITGRIKANVQESISHPQYWIIQGCQNRVG